MSLKPRRLRTNLRHDADGFQAYTTVDGRFRSRRYGIEPTKAEVQAWVDAQHLPRSERRSVGRGTLAYDVRVRYLPARAAMPSIADRMRHLEDWIFAFGEDTARGAITALEIQTQRDRWLTVGPRRIQKRIAGQVQWVLIDRPLSAHSVNLRLRALSNLFRVLDGPQATNPVRDVPEVQESEAVPRAVSYRVLLEILGKMTDRSRRRSGERYRDRRTESLAKVRTEVLMWTGVTPMELQRIDKAAIDWDQRYLIVPPRQKGRGAPGRIVPLVPQALAALRRFDRLETYGAFNVGVVRRAWQRACAVVGKPGLRLYDVRHSFVTRVLAATRDFQQAQLLAGHTDPRTTRRYAMAAILPTLERGMAAAFGHPARRRRA